MTMPPLPHFYVTWPESDVPLAEFLRYHVYHRLFGDTEWTLKAQISDRSNTSYNDYEVRSGQVYEVAVTQWQDISGEEVESDFPESPPQVSVAFTWTFLHNVLNPGQYIGIPNEQQELSSVQDIRFLTPYSRRQPTAFVGNGLTQTIRVPYRDSWEDMREIWQGVQGLQEAQRDGATLMVRQANDVHLFCMIDQSINRADARVLSQVGIPLREVYYPESVEVA